MDGMAHGNGMVRKMIPISLESCQALQFVAMTSLLAAPL